MSYATLTDLNNFGLVASATSTITDAVKTAELEAASEYIDGFLRSRYKLPLTSWGQDIRIATVIVAIHHLMSRRGYMPSSGADTVIRQRFDDIKEWLHRVGRQEIQPNVHPNTQDDASLAAPRVITKPLRGW